MSVTFMRNPLVGNGRKWKDGHVDPSDERRCEVEHFGKIMSLIEDTSIQGDIYHRYQSLKEVKKSEDIFSRNRSSRLNPRV